MALNESKGQMYEFVTHTQNYLKGSCSHLCKYCYMKKWGMPNNLRLDEKEFKTNLGSNNFIFIGSSTDMFANDVPHEWISRILTHLNNNPQNRYLFQTKNPKRLYAEYLDLIPEKSVIGTTIESDIFYKDIMCNSPLIEERASYLRMIKNDFNCETFVTIEPIMKFDFAKFVVLLHHADPDFVNIGANTDYKTQLPEPSKAEVLQLIDELKKFTRVNIKDNLKRLIK